MRKRTRMVYLEATPADSGDSCRAVAVDITSTRQAETAYRESEERLKLAVTAGHLGVWEWDCESEQIFWSPECCTISGVNQLCFTPESLAKLVHPKDLDRITAEFKRALADGRVHSVEFHIVRPGGEVVWRSVLGQARRDEEDNTLRVFGVAHDLTERERGASSRRILTRQLEWCPADESHKRSSFRRVKACPGRFQVGAGIQGKNGFLIYLDPVS